MIRLTGSDATFLYMQNASSHMEVAAVVVIDPSSAKEPFSFARARDVVASRLHLVPPFRRRLVHVPFELDTPRWIEDPDFDLDYHVRRGALPAPGGIDELAGYAAEVMSRPLDRSKPLWELHIVEGLEDGRVAVVSKTHHAAVDGVSGAELLASLVDLEPDAPDPDPPEEPWRPEREPSDLELLASSLGALVRQPWRGVKATRRLVRAVARDQLGRRRAGGGGDAPTSASDTPPSPFNVTVTPHRRVHLRDVALDDVKAVKDATGTSLNDALLAVCGGALREYLLGRGELPDESLVAFVPVSTRTESAGAEGGNETSVVFSTLATDVDEPLERLRIISAAMTAAKEEHGQVGAATVTDLTEIAGPAGAALAGRLVGRLGINQRVRASGNVVISNIPGPPVPLYIAGGSVDAIYPLGPVVDGSALNITVMSYLDRLHVGLAADRETVPDLPVLGDLIDAHLAELVKLTGA